MSTLTISKFAGLALGAAVVGSTVGTVLLVADYFLGHPNRSPHHSLWEIFVSPAVWLMSLCGTIPGALIIGLPVVYPFRHFIGRHPYLSFIPTVVLAMAISFALLGWAFKQQIGDKYSDLEVLWCYSGSVAFGFVFMLAWWYSRQSKKQAE
ncbi:hypothetical protein [Sphingomonas sp. M1-B02]|uniref:hypothetical protein n=1 Tax=Sphingomonas sp. M1-B02 TaxID=3114300 RepID=UPI002240A102|nr:hypothetical protein [Sphingomonas sp. S6-11]UZK67595.1 hypothetical protein OKW87_07140 [Sphingomonas sp. S6-11]